MTGISLIFLVVALYGVDSLSVLDVTNTKGMTLSRSSERLHHTLFVFLIVSLTARFDFLSMLSFNDFN